MSHPRVQAAQVDATSRVSQPKRDRPQPLPSLFQFRPLSYLRLTQGNLSVLEISGAVIFLFRRLSCSMPDEPFTGCGCPSGNGTFRKWWVSCPFFTFNIIHADFPGIHPSIHPSIRPSHPPSKCSTKSEIFTPNYHCHCQLEA
jgi:hypothetical protein